MGELDGLLQNPITQKMVEQFSADLGKTPEERRLDSYLSMSEFRKYYGMGKSTLSVNIAMYDIEQLRRLTDEVSNTKAKR